MRDACQGLLAEPAALVIALLHEADGGQVPQGCGLARVELEGLIPRVHGAVVVLLLRGREGGGRVRLLLVYFLIQLRTLYAVFPISFILSDPSASGWILSSLARRRFTRGNMMISAMKLTSQVRIE